MGAKLMIWGVGDAFGDGDVLAALCGSWFVEVSKGAGAGWVCKEQGCCVSLAIRTSETEPIIVHGSYGCWAVQWKKFGDGTLAGLEEHMLRADACSILYHQCRCIL
jgi:hypothetical protein